VNDSAIEYGVLLGCFGAGSIGRRLDYAKATRSFLDGNDCLSGGAIVGVGIIAITRLHSLRSLAPVILVSGAAWVLFISLINALVQNLAPEWVQARVLAIFSLVYMGSFALGSAVWGGLAQRRGIGLALIYSGFGTVGSVILALIAKLPDAAADLTPWNHWRMQ